MNKHLVALILVLSFPVLVYAQKPEYISLVQDMQPGKVYKLEVQRATIEPQVEGSDKMKLSMGVVCTVKRQGAQRACVWKYGKTVALGVDPKSIDKRTAMLLNIYEGLELKFLIDESGRMQELQNYEECKIFLRNAFEKVLKAAEKPASPGDVEKMLDVLKSTFDTPDIMIMTYFPELNLYFNMAGESIKTDSVYVSDAELPNPLDGPSFPTLLTIKVENMVNTTATVSLKQVLSEDKLVTIMQQTVKQMSEKAGKPLTLEDMPNIKMSTFTTFQYDYKKKEMKEVYGEKYMEVGTRIKTQTLRVTLKE